MTDKKKGVSFDEAKKESLKFFNGDELAADAFLKKYALTTRDGKSYIETTPEQMWRRLAKACAAVTSMTPY